jgi:hypothetical protein
MREKETQARASIFGDRDGRAHFVRKGAVGESADMLQESDFELIDRFAGRALRRLGYEVRPDKHDRLE